MMPPAVVSARTARPLWILAALLWAACAWFWLVPLARPRGPLWGQYSAADLLLGAPAAVLAVLVSLVLASPAPRRRKIAYWLAAAGASVLVAAAGFDLYYTLAVLGAWRPNYWLDRAHISRLHSMADPELGFVRKPRVTWRGNYEGRVIDYRTDENGFRNPPGLRRAGVVFIGDSFTEAAQVDEDVTFVRRVAAASGLTTVNLGRAAYGPQQEAIVLERYGLKYGPRFAIWQFFSGNDASDALEFAEWRRDPNARQASLLSRYVSNSLIRKWMETVFGLRTAQATPARLHLTGGPSEDIFIRYERPAAVPPQALVEMRSALERGVRVCRERSIRLLVISIPTMRRVLEPYIDGLPRDSTEQPGPAAFAPALDGLCREQGCTFIDASEALRQAAAQDNRGLYIPNDEHLDARGHEVVAGLVIKWLKSGR